MKSQIWLSAILYILIITVVMVVVLDAGMPIIRDLQDKTVFARSKNAFLSLNENINQISEEGVGSQRVVPIEIEKGKLELRDGALRWDFLTNAKIVEPGAQIDLGNLQITSNADVIARNYPTNYSLENTYLAVHLAKCEDRSTCAFNESSFLFPNQPVFKNPDDGSAVPAEGQFKIDFGAGAAWNYSGFSVMETEGSGLGAGRVLYYINNTNSSYYTIIEFSLESNRDFIQVRIR